MTLLATLARRLEYGLINAARSWSASPRRARLERAFGVRQHHPSLRARETPEKTCVLMAGTGQRLSYKELNDASLRAARLFRESGLRVGDGVALLLENHVRFFELCWAAQRSGLYYTPINCQLTVNEVSYIVNDCGAKVFVTSRRHADVAVRLAGVTPRVERRFMIDEAVAGFEPFESSAEQQPALPLADETEGRSMLYSSGTTGRPKGVTAQLSGGPITMMPPVVNAFARLFAIDERCVYLSPGPLYHAAPFMFCMTVQTRGGTCVVMEKFDAEALLRLIEQHRITHIAVVPTMFVRLLKLPTHVRQKYDLSSLEVVIHGAAPCPVSIKEQMIAWWGPKLYEYYSATEGNVFCFIDSDTWLKHRGSVGRPVLGPVHIVDERGRGRAPGEVGEIWSAAPSVFHYHNDPGQTASVRNDRGWTTLGDIGYLDEEGYLYLTDRKWFTVISGGVKVYPREVEDVLIGHPKVADVAVIGVPDHDLGEVVLAVVQPSDLARAGPDLERELLSYCRERLAHFKCPRAVEFAAELPRHDNGKLYKQSLKERYARTHEPVVG
jgi:long-chain acyl-CoA synthetase